MSLSQYDVERHLPLITPRIEFNLAPDLPLPMITPRIEFEVDPQGNLRPVPSVVEQAVMEQAGPTLPPSGDPHSTPSTPSSAVTAPPSSPAVTVSSSQTTSTPTSSSPQTPSTPATSSAPAAKIPKPNGEPGRPGSGGFNLEATLTSVHMWPENQVLDFMEFVRAEARRSLDMSVSYRSQRKAALDGLCDKAMEDSHFPALKNYDNCWPVRSALKLVLKYKAEASRRTAGRSTTNQLRRLLRGTAAGNEEENAE